jgi:hypothetical protein
LSKMLPRKYGDRIECQRRWKTRPHASVRTGQFRAVFSDGRDWVSALARALPI